MQEALDVAKSIAKPFEGFSLKIYVCPAGKRTIYWGHVVLKGEAFNGTQVEGETILSKDMAKALLGTLKQCPILAKDARRLGAITDFTFNLGSGRLQTSTLRRRINQRNWPEAVKELNKWVRGGGRILKGLVLRRAAEGRYIQ